ncbi:MAG: hypothetical protein LC722_03905 [Actinobacteria bacterium]|nr:hypothetical protein [Actinomycetota bacterium]
MWVPTFVFQPAGTAVPQDVFSIAGLMLVFLGPLAWAGGRVAGRTDDERRRFWWLVGVGVAASVGGWLIVSFAGDVFTCGGKGAPSSAGEVVCASSTLERIAGVVLVEAAILVQWGVARREWHYRPRSRVNPPPRGNEWIR